MRRRPFHASEEAAENFWPSFTDLISTISLILFVLVLVAFMQNLISGKKLAGIKAMLDQTSVRLEASRAEISRSERKLQLLEDDLKRTSAEIEAGQTRLTMSEERVREQQEIIAQSNGELGNLRAKLEGIAVLRVEVLDKVRRSIEQELTAATLGRAPQVLIGDNGNIIIGEKLVFEYDSHTIKPEGKALLDMLAHSFEKVLAEDGLRENIDVILVQGHTDDRGSSGYNRELSSKRANAVLDYLFESDRALEKRYGSLFASSGYSEFRPLSAEKSEAAYEQNRRIEISVVLKDAQVRRTIDDYMKRVNPLLTTPPPAAPQ